MNKQGCGIRGVEGFWVFSAHGDGEA